MFGNQEVCIGLNVAVKIIPLVQIMQLESTFCQAIYRSR